MKSALLISICLAVSACSTAPLQLESPVVVHATVNSPVWTGWVRDYCNDGRPVEFEKLSGPCMNLGSEINSATITNVRIVNGTRIGDIKIVFVGHALPKSYKRQHYLVLLPSPADFRAATGLAYFAGDRDNFDAGKQCLSDQGYSHISFNDCKYKSFHEHPKSGCIPIQEYLAHYRSGP